MRVAVDADLCIGCGQCVEICPEVFEMSDDDVAKVKHADVPPDLEDACRNAAEECPVDAISVES